ncbi:hypothetical protein [Streptomyces sp. cg36]|uniref:hypothetical protein n=1 Tax=Streptomyces sp. cg36 TaxID=3238798 RepID=UPI0034E2433F
MSVWRTPRGVVHRLLRHPDSEVTLTARCMSGDGCSWELDATSDLDDGGVAIIEHTAGTGHTLFARSVEDMACVVLTTHQDPPRRAGGPRPEPETAEEHERPRAEW